MADINWGLASAGATLAGFNFGAGPGTNYDITWANDGTKYDGSNEHAFYGTDGDTLDVTLVSAKTISKVVLWFTNTASPSTPPGDATAADGYQPTAFKVYTWNGASWVQQASVTSNTLAKRTITFGAVSTDQVRFEIVTADVATFITLLQEIEIIELDLNAVGTSASTSTANGVGQNTYTGSVSEGHAASTSAATGVGRNEQYAVGTSASVSWARAHPPYAHRVLTNMGALGATVVQGYHATSPAQWVMQAARSNVVDGNTATGHSMITAPITEWVYRIQLANAINLVGLRLRTHSAGSAFKIDIMRVFANPTLLPMTAPAAPMDTGSPDDYDIAADGYTDRPVAEGGAGIFGTQATDLVFADSLWHDRTQFVQQLDVYVRLQDPAFVVEMREIEVIGMAFVYIADVDEPATVAETIVTHTRTTIVESAIGSDTADGARVGVVIEGAIGSDVASTSADRVTTTVVESALGSDSIEYGLAAYIVEPAIGSDTAGGDRLHGPLIEPAIGSDLVSSGSTRTGTVVEAAYGYDTVETRKSVTVVEPAIGADLAVVARRIGATIEEPALGSDVSASIRYTSATVDEPALGMDLASSQTHAHATIIELAIGYDDIVLPAADYVALWVNPRTTAAAVWEGLKVNSMIEIDGVVYGAGPAGIYQIVDDADDAGQRVVAEVMWDLLDFGESNKKHYESVFIGAHAAGALVVRAMNEQGSFQYRTHLPRTAKATNLRAVCGRGLESRYVRFSVMNDGGKHFNINDVQVEMSGLTRKIGGKHA